MKNKIDVDREFSRLEQLAFKGKWDFDEQKRLWHNLGIYDVGKQGIATNAEHDRLQHIIVVYWAMSKHNDPKHNNPKTAANVDFETIQSYVEKYPACVAYLPKELHKTMFPEERQAEDEQR